MAPKRKASGEAAGSQPAKKKAAVTKKTSAPAPAPTRRSSRIKKIEEDRKTEEEAAPPAAPAPKTKQATKAKNSAKPVSKGPAKQKTEPKIKAKPVAKPKTSTKRKKDDSDDEDDEEGPSTSKAPPKKRTKTSAKPVAKPAAKTAPKPKAAPKTRTTRRTARGTTNIVESREDDHATSKPKAPTSKKATADPKAKAKATRTGKSSVVKVAESVSEAVGEFASTTKPLKPTAKASKSTKAGLGITEALTTISQAVGSAVGAVNKATSAIPFIIEDSTVSDPKLGKSSTTASQGKRGKSPSKTIPSLAPTQRASSPRKSPGPVSQPEGAAKRASSPSKSPIKPTPSLPPSRRSASPEKQATLPQAPRSPGKQRAATQSPKKASSTLSQVIPATENTSSSPKKSLISSKGPFSARVLAPRGENSASSSALSPVEELISPLGTTLRLLRAQRLPDLPPRAPGSQPWIPEKLDISEFSDLEDEPEASSGRDTRSRDHTTKQKNNAGGKQHSDTTPDPVTNSPAKDWRLELVGEGEKDDQEHQKAPPAAVLKRKRPTAWNSVQRQNIAQSTATETTAPGDVNPLNRDNSLEARRAERKAARQAQIQRAAPRDVAQGQIQVTQQIEITRSTVTDTPATTMPPPTARPTSRSGPAVDTGRANVGSIRSSQIAPGSANSGQNNAPVRPPTPRPGQPTPTNADYLAQLDAITRSPVDPPSVGQTGLSYGPYREPPSAISSSSDGSGFGSGIPGLGRARPRQNQPQSNARAVNASTPNITAATPAASFFANLLDEVEAQRTPQAGSPEQRSIYPREAVTPDIGQSYISNDESSILFDDTDAAYRRQTAAPSTHVGTSRNIRATEDSFADDSLFGGDISGFAYREDDYDDDDDQPSAGSAGNDESSGTDGSSSNSQGSHGYNDGINARGAVGKRRNPGGDSSSSSSSSDGPASAKGDPVQSSSSSFSGSGHSQPHQTQKLSRGAFSQEQGDRVDDNNFELDMGSQSQTSSSNYNQGRANGQMTRSESSPTDSDIASIMGDLDEDGHIRRQPRRGQNPVDDDESEQRNHADNSNPDRHQ